MNYVGNEDESVLHYARWGRGGGLFIAQAKSASARSGFSI